MEPQTETQASNQPIAEHTVSANTTPLKLFGGKKQLQAQKEDLSQELYRRNLELFQNARTLELLRTISTLVLESKEEIGVLCQKIADSFMTLPNYLSVAILANPPHSDFFKLFGFATSIPNLPDIEKHRVEVDLYNDWVVKPDRIKVIDASQLTDEMISGFVHTTTEKITNLRSALPVKTIVLAKLVARYRIVGVMAFGFAKNADEITQDDITTLTRYSEAVGIALDNKLLFEENQMVMRELQRSNAKLKTLDQTKDEFISMASHQLRTPLTSVKGYLSMVLEGDVGDISEMQRKLLQQAFTSSQRMVFLIADLLNVSRLKTGKFVIDAVPTRLDKVVGDEIEQIMPIAEAKGMHLIYEKPENFPELLLDETKIRQVIMNFIDNAIYYTPAGGTITAALKEEGDNVTYTVTDDGMGISRKDQIHLFSKFYRASNARKARPDGTGLGLFMAKKVIVAQGGSVVFKSELNKGSTFGFTFNKAKLTSAAEDAAKEKEIAATNENNAGMEQPATPVVAASTNAETAAATAVTPLAETPATNDAPSPIEKAG